MSVELNGWYWVEWRNTLEPELFRDGRIQDHDGDWIMPSPTRKIGPRLPGPEEMKATELELAKLRNRVDDLHATFIETQEERDRLRADNAKYLDMIQKMYWTAGLISDGDELEAVKRLREERDRLRAEVERLRPKEDDGWRFFDAKDRDVWVMSHRGGFLYNPLGRTMSETRANIGKCISDGDTELAASDAYSRLDGWPEGQRKFLELTGYVPPTCKESLPVRPEERVRCYSNDICMWVAVDGEPLLYVAGNQDMVGASSCMEGPIKQRPDVKRIPLAEALDIVRDRPKQLAKLQEMAGIVTPKDSVRCYSGRDGKLRCYKDRDECLFLGSQEDFDLAQPEQCTIDDGGKRIPLTEALEIVRDRPKQLAKLREMAWIETPHIAEPDENQKHLARLMAIPCKEMRV